MVPPPSAALRIGDFRVDPALDEISKDGGTTKLEPRSMRLLVCLAERAGHVVSVEQLLDLVWKDVVVSTDSVYQAVASLRRILGDDPKEPTYIANVMRRGYRLIATVEPWVEPTSPGSPAPAVLNPDPLSNLRERDSLRSRLRRRRLIIAMACTATIGGSSATWREPHVDVDGIATQSVDGKQSVTAGARFTIAVIVFDESANENYDGEAAQALAETVRQRLGRSQKMIVIARGSSMAAAGQSADTRSIGRRLGARYLVRGTVERVKDRLHVTAQLLDVESGRQLQSFAVDQLITNIMDLQKDIGGRIAKGVSIQLTGIDLPPQSNSRSTSLDAYLKFLDAQALLDRETTEASEQAALILGQVTRMDPTFAIAYAELARARWSALENDSKEERASLLPLVEKALMLDSTLGEAYSIRAALESDHKLAEADFRKGIELAPNYAPGYELYAESLYQGLDEGMDMMVRALDMMDRAIPIDPLTAHYIGRKAAYLYFNMHQSAAGEKLFLQAAAMDPDLAGVNMSLAYIEWRKGEIAEGVKLIERALRSEPKLTEGRDLACAMYLDLGDRQAAKSVAVGAPADSQSTVLLAAYDRDFQKAAAHYGDWMNFDEPQVAYWISVDAAARQSGTVAKTIARLRAEFPLSAVKNGTAPRGEFDAALTIVGDLLRAQGDQASLAQVLPPLKALLDKNERRSGWAHGYFNVLAGDPDGALALLAINIHRQHLGIWWILERDPIWADLRNDIRFRDALAIEHKRVAEQRAILERMRQSGEVSRRNGDNHMRVAFDTARKKL